MALPSLGVSFCATGARGWLVAVGGLILSAVSPATLAQADDAATVEARLSDAVKYLASDELEGRGIGTQGLNAAADYIAGQFREIGLRTDVVDGGPFQKFTMTTGATLGDSNRLVLVRPPAKEGEAPRRVELKVGEEYNPMALGGSAKFDLPLVFVGYGITAKDEGYDDYAGVDVKGKAVIVLRHEPQQNNPHSAFEGTRNSRHAPFSRKVSNAYEHGAAAVIFLTDDYDIRQNLADVRKRWQAAVDDLVEENARYKKIAEPTAAENLKHEQEIAKFVADIQKFSAQLETAQDPLLPFEGAGSDGEGRDFPVITMRRKALDEVVRAALGQSLVELEAAIDKGPQPQSRALTGWHVEGETTVVRNEAEVKNVIGVLDGAGPHADETIVIGAHYDHLGYGGPGSAAPGVKEIHNGADDNGSGSTVLIEVARQFLASGKKPPRRLVFIAFTGEERGLIGSARYVRNPLFPLDSTVAMLNLDMVGRLKDEKLIVHGTGTATEFDALVDRFGKDAGFHLTKQASGFGPSDHSSFYGAKVPVLFFFTGSHKDYHRPSDDFDKLNVSGMRRIADLVVQVATTLAEAESRPTYQEVKGASPIGGGGDRPYFGSIPDFAQDQPGYALSGVSKGGPADKAGLKTGDIIVQLGESKVGNLEDFDNALRKHKSGDKVPVTVKRGQESVTVEVTLDPPR
ncbi:MAG: M20/M25/M40 family metallo-hydrolase [Pirellulales bacterium]